MSAPTTRDEWGPVEELAASAGRLEGEGYRCVYAGGTHDVWCNGTGHAWRGGVIPGATHTRCRYGRCDCARWQAERSTPFPTLRDPLALLRRAHALLERMQWVEDIDEAPHCPICKHVRGCPDAPRDFGHGRDCELSSLLRELAREGAEP